MHRSEMFLFVTFLFFFASTCSARPNNFYGPKNMITAPTNCPPGQQWVNGQCRDVWRAVTEPSLPSNCPEGQEFVNGACRDDWLKKGIARNFVTVPTNCKPPKQWVNGVCRDVWRRKNVIQVPPNCAPGQEYVNGECRDVWRSQNPNAYYYINSLGNDDNNKNVISVPNQCPAGYKPDALGNCREIV